MGMEPTPLRVDKIRRILLKRAPGFGLGRCYVAGG
jgi:hypothetical protein